MRWEFEIRSVRFQAVPADQAVCNHGLFPCGPLGPFSLYFLLLASHWVRQGRGIQRCVSPVAGDGLFLPEHTVSPWKRKNEGKRKRYTRPEPTYVLAMSAPGRTRSRQGPRGHRAPEGRPLIAPPSPLEETCGRPQPWETTDVRGEGSTGGPTLTKQGAPAADSSLAATVISSRVAYVAACWIRPCATARACSLVLID